MFDHQILKYLKLKYSIPIDKPQDMQVFPNMEIIVTDGNLYRKDFTCA
ncbi:hypothetical protein ABID22_001192 [Pontibacter aydingkolensis]